MRDEAVRSGEVSLQRPCIDLLLVSNDKLAVRNASQRINGVCNPTLYSVEARVGARGCGDNDMLSIALPWQYIRAHGAPSVVGEFPDCR
jgi:hypothetical protein